MLPPVGATYAQAIALQQECLYDTWGQHAATMALSGYYALVSTPSQKLQDYEVYWCETNNKDELVGPV